VSGGTLTPRPAAAARLLHTSDWHLGVTVRGQSRASDHDAAIGQLLDIARQAQPDLIVHTGDLFDNHRPPMAEFGRAITALRALAEFAPVCVLAGNHDSATTLEVLATALGDDSAQRVAEGRYDPYGTSPGRIRILPRPTTAARGAVATYPSRAGVDIRLVAVPFVHANRVLTDFAELTNTHATYADRLRQITQTLTADGLAHFDPVRQVAVLATHLHVAGSRLSSERSIHVSSDYATDPVNFGAEYAYVACGHIHVPQEIGGGRGRYAGSLIQVDFGEEGEVKQVVVVDAEPGRPAQRQLVTIDAGRPLRRVRTTLTELAELADEIGPAMVEVTLTADGTDPDGPIVVGGTGYDSLAGAVHALLPAATVVAVVDGRRVRRDTSGVVASSTNTITSLGETFRHWLTQHGTSLLERQTHADQAGVATLFDEIYAAVVAGDAPRPSGLAPLQRDEEVS
jgi:exonuclease SbcD